MATFPPPRNVTLNEMNCDWLFDMLVKRPRGRALANKSCHLFQTFSRQSEGLATRDYVLIIILNPIHILFSAFCSKCCLFLYFLFMKLTHIQAFIKKMHEARIKYFCLQADTLFFLLMFWMFRYSYNKIYKH